MSKSSSRNGLNVSCQWILAVAFLALLILPALDLALDLDPVPPIEENRKLATYPEIGWTPESLAAFTKGLDGFLADHFGFRHLFVRAYYLTRALGFGNPFDSTVLVGRQGHLYANSGGGVSDLYRGVKPFRGWSGAGCTRAPDPGCFQQ